jgi:lipid II:glycine glycyltransferase (peptidoglycan interpeptide bridge formation enzyme)
MAPYMLQWEAIREGKLRWCTTYDFLGIAPPGQEDHPLAWVSSFKEKFGWKPVRIGAKKLFILGHICYAIFVPLRMLKNVFRMIRSRLSR